MSKVNIMNNKEISISEIANAILASNTFDGDSIVCLPVRSKKSNNNFSNLIDKIAKKISEEGYKVLLVKEKGTEANVDSKVDVCDIQNFFHHRSGNDKYDLTLILSPGFNTSSISQTMVRKGKKIILIVEEFFSTEKDLSDDIKEIENLGAEVLGAIYVER